MGPPAMEVPEPPRAPISSVHRLQCERANLQKLAENAKKNIVEKVNKNLTEISGYGPEMLGAILLDLQESLQKLDKYTAQEEGSKVEETINTLRLYSEQIFKIAENIREANISEEDYELDIEQYYADKETEKAQSAELKNQSQGIPNLQEKMQRNIIISMWHRMRAAKKAVTSVFTRCF